MTLLTRVNLTLGAAFLLGVGISGAVAHRILQEDAKRQGIETVRLVLASATASRDYTKSEIVPLLAPRLVSAFMPQMVPSYAATRSLELLRKDHPDFIYREATLNPTNPRDRPSDWEADIIHQFRSDNSLKELNGERMTALGLSMYLARPIRASSVDCIVCHGTAASAPPTMTAIYGTVNGFGWELNEVVGSQIMSVPMASALAKADHAFYVFLYSMVGVFVLVFALVNVMMHVIVLRPIARIVDVSERVSNGDLSGAAFEPTGNDEIAQLGRSFERMRRSLAKSLTLLGG
jgi:HAMP domain-containing protein